MDLQDKVVLITGSTSGIGKATALLFAKKGATVIIVGRNKEATLTTAAEIKQQTGNEHVESFIADLSSQASIRKLAQDFKDTHKRLDVLIHCAALFTSKRTTTDDGLETMFATNYLAPFLLTHLLLDQLKTGKQARIINVSANSPLKPNFNDLQGKKKFSATRAFGTTKAGNLLFTYALSRRLKDTGITVNAYHPGVTRGTNLMNHAPVFFRLIMSLASPFLKTPEVAAKGLIELATSSTFDTTSGQLICNGKPMQAPLQNDIDLQERLWDESVKLAGLK